MHFATISCADDGRWLPTDPSHDDELRRGDPATREVSRRGGRGAGGELPAARSTRVPLGQALPRMARRRGVTAARPVPRAPTRREPAHSSRTISKQAVVRARRSCSRACSSLLDALRPRRQPARRRSGATAGSTTRRASLHVAGPGFLDPRRASRARARRARRRRRRRSTPIRARRSSTFNAAARAARHPLVLFPVPDKAAVAAAASCTARGATRRARAARNPDCDRFAGRAARQRAWRCSIRRQALPSAERAPALPGARHALDAGLDGARRARPRASSSSGLARAAAPRRADAAHGRRVRRARRRSGRHARAARRTDVCSARRR